MRAYKRVRSENLDVMKLQDAVVDQIDDIKTCPFLDGLLLTGITITSAGTTFAHKLGRTPQGWFTTDRNAAATLYRNAWTADTVTLTSSADITVSIWIF